MEPFRAVPTRAWVADYGMVAEEAEEFAIGVLRAVLLHTRGVYDTPGLSALRQNEFIDLLVKCFPGIVGSPLAEYTSGGATSLVAVIRYGVTPRSADMW